MNAVDVAIAGAGVVGAACAAEFVSAGLRVAVIEPGAIGGGATAAGMGHLAVMDDSEAQFALTRYSQVLWRELAERLPVESEYLGCGSLWVAADDEEMEEVHRKERFYRERNVPVEVLDAQALADAEPQLRRGLAGGLRLPDDAVVYSPSVAKWLLAGAEVVQGRRVVELREHGVQLDDGSTLAARWTVLATGAMARTLIPELPVKPRKGHLLITDRYPGFLRHQLIELGYLKSAHQADGDSVAFNAQPRRTGQILIGSSRQYGVADPKVETQMLNAMLRRAIEYMPALAGLSALRAWTGFRAATPDKLPLIGLCPEYRNVYLATGHEGLGISTSLGTARLLADQMLGRESAIARDPYSPGRPWEAHG